MKSVGFHLELDNTLPHMMDAVSSANPYSALMEANCAIQNQNSSPNDATEYREVV